VFRETKLTVGLVITDHHTKIVETKETGDHHGGKLR
jgi:hypothetical protein